jgi:melibiose permease/lactose/raffinose/galactose permease
MFADFGFTDIRFVIIFGVAYILWDIAYGINDIAYWSMMPSLTLDQKKSKKMQFTPLKNRSMFPKHSKDEKSL